ncbi:MAG: murein L,D-transpeptidase catalytic domain family protein [Ignavibacteriaceae bacterium]|nr:murein L,D-transpeptidase catalytic domain family protein [Ignavibacteriaceae bacterium]
MRTFLFALIGVFSLLSNSISNSAPGERNINSDDSITPVVDSYDVLLKNLYTECNLTDKLDYDIFKQAMEGYTSIDLANKKLISIIDYSKPSNEKRFFIIDIENRKLLYQIRIAQK